MIEDNEMKETPVEKNAKKATGLARPRKPLWRRILKWTVRVVVAMVVLVVLVLAIWNYVASKQLGDEISKVRAAGQPVTFAELSASVLKAAPADDAGPYYAAALDLVATGNVKGAEELNEELHQSLVAGGAPPELISRGKAMLEANRLVLEMVDRGSDKAGCNFEFGLQYGMGSFLPRMANARSVARALSLRTRLAAADGQGDQAVDSLVSSLRMLRMFDRQPMLIVFLVRVACLALADSDVPYILEFGRPSPEALARLAKALEEADQSTDLRRAMMAERVYSLATMRSLAAGTGELNDTEGASLPEGLPGNVAASPFMRSAAVGLLRFWAKNIDHAARGWPGLLPQIKQEDSSGHGGLNDLFASLLRPSLYRATVMIGRCLASVRPARVAIMIEQYRRAKGALPQSLGELEAFVGKPLPLSPFTGRGLMYKVSDSEYLVYSPGEAGVDHQGAVLNYRDAQGGYVSDTGDVTDWGVRVRMKLPETQPTGQ